MFKGIKNTTPYTTKAKFESLCAETGKTIKKGDECIYYPSSKKVFHPNSKQASEFRAWSFDCDMLGHNY